MRARAWTNALIVSLLVAAALAVWVNLRFAALFEAVEEQSAAAIVMESSHMIYRSADGRVIVVTPNQGESAREYMRRARRIVTTILQGGDPGINQKVDSWTDELGGLVIVVVSRMPGESRQAWCDRFDEQVAEARLAFPCEE